jgi:protein TonB
MSATLAAHTAQRAEQSASLQKGIALSAGFHLTLAVLLFGVLGIVRNLPTQKSEEADDEIIHVLYAPPTDPGGGSTPQPTNVPFEEAPVVAVDDDDDLAVDPPAEIAPPAADPGLADGLFPGKPSPSTGEIGRIGEEVFPEPNVPVFADILPEPIRKVVPVYPEIARQAGIEGKVWVRLLVDRTGVVRKAEIERGSSMFDDEALQAARQWKFRPAVAAGNPVAVWVRIPFDFRMK